MDAIFEQLRDVVIGTARSGQRKLPTERELAALLGVPRGSLRERLSALEALGVLRQTQGSGTYIATPDPRFVELFFEIALRVGHFEVEDLERVREMIEREVVREAAMSATGDDIAALEETYARMLATSDVDEGDRADFDFHTRLARAAKNPVMMLLSSGLSSVLAQVLRERRAIVRSDARSLDVTNATHEPILQAIRRHDPELAVRAMDDHFSVWNTEADRLAQALARKKRARG